MRVLEVDQWAVRDTEGKPFADFDRGTVTAGDAGVAMRVFGGHAMYREVLEDDYPSIGEAWFISQDGLCHLWKANFDSSD